MQFFYLKKYRFVLYIMLLQFCFISGQSKQEQKSLQLKKARLKREIATFKDLLHNTTTKKASVLSKIEQVSLRIAKQQELLEITNLQANACREKIIENRHQIKFLDKQLKSLKQEYSHMIYESYKNQNKPNRLLFLFSSKDFYQAYKRLQYLQQYTKYRKEQGEKIAQQSKLLEKVNKDLVEQQKQKQALLIENRRLQETLANQRKKQERLAVEIRKKEGGYLRKLKAKKRQAVAIDKALDKLIKASIVASNKKSGATKNTTTLVLTKGMRRVATGFASRKGALIWPVENGVIYQHYGAYSDPVYPAVKSFRSGVTIAANKGAKARAVYQGEVSAINRIPGGNKAVQIRHGNYITIYYNLSQVYVKQGQQVTQKQPIGELFSNPVTGKALLKFLVYKDTKRLNPERWIKAM